MPYLHVRIVEATGLPWSAPQVRTQLNGLSVSGSQPEWVVKQKAMKESYSPLWNASHTFSINRHDLDTAHLSFELRLKSDAKTSLGFAHFHLDYFQTQLSSQQASASSSASDLSSASSAITDGSGAQPCEFKGWIPVRKKPVPSASASSSTSSGILGGSSSKQSSPAMMYSTAAGSSSAKMESLSLNPLGMTELERSVAAKQRGESDPMGTMIIDPSSTISETSIGSTSAGSQSMSEGLLSKRYQISVQSGASLTSTKSQPSRGKLKSVAGVAGVKKPTSSSKIRSKSKPRSPRSPRSLDGSMSKTQSQSSTKSGVAGSSGGSTTRSWSSMDRSRTTSDFATSLATSTKHTDLSLATAERLRKKPLIRTGLSTGSSQSVALFSPTVVETTPPPPPPPRRPLTKSHSGHPRSVSRGRGESITKGTVKKPAIHSSSKRLHIDSEDDESSKHKTVIMKTSHRDDSDESDESSGEDAFTGLVDGGVDLRSLAMSTMALGSPSSRESGQYTGSQLLLKAELQDKKTEYEQQQEQQRKMFEAMQRRRKQAASKREGSPGAVGAVGSGYGSGAAGFRGGGGPGGMIGGGYGSMSASADRSVTPDPVSPRAGREDRSGSARSLGAQRLEQRSRTPPASVSPLHRSYHHRRGDTQGQSGSMGSLGMSALTSGQTPVVSAGDIFSAEPRTRAGSTEPPRIGRTATKAKLEALAMADDSSGFTKASTMGLFTSIEGLGLAPPMLGFVDESEEESAVVSDSVKAALKHGGRTKNGIAYRLSHYSRLYVVISVETVEMFGSRRTPDEIKQSRRNCTKLTPQVSDPIPLRMFCGSYNCGNSRLDGLFHWIPQNESVDGGVDVYVLALQECKPTVKAIPPELPDEERMTDEERAEFEKQEKKVQVQVLRALIAQIGDEYRCIASKNMWQIRLFVFVREELTHRVSGVTMAQVTTGVGGVGKNKGCVVIAFDFEGVSMCFVGAHLAAHQTKVTNRNNDYKKICHDLQMGHFKEQLLAKYHYVFWMGDLNYRVDWMVPDLLDGGWGGSSAAVKAPEPSNDTDGALSMKEMFAMMAEEDLKEDDIPGSPSQKGASTGPVFKDKPPEIVFQNFCDALLTRSLALYDTKIVNPYDQLRRMIRNGTSFAGFYEGIITFQPTFKVQRQEFIKYQNQRLPAWCDRVLYRCATTGVHSAARPVVKSRHRPNIGLHHTTLNVNFEAIAPTVIWNEEESALQKRIAEGIGAGASALSPPGSHKPSLADASDALLHMMDSPSVDGDDDDPGHYDEDDSDDGDAAEEEEEQEPSPLSPKTAEIKSQAMQRVRKPQISGDYLVNSLKVLDYRCYDGTEAPLSDHKPVSCLFELDAWPRLPSLDDDFGEAFITLTECSAKELVASDMSGTSDPFVLFPPQELLKDTFSSSRIDRTLNPVWLDEDFPKLKLRRNCVGFLEKSLLIVHVFDHDRFSANDLIGVGVIPVYDLVQSLCFPTPLEIELTLDGRPAGVFKCTATLYIQPKETDSGPTKKKGLLSRMFGGGGVKKKAKPKHRGGSSDSSKMKTGSSDGSTIVTLASGGRMRNESYASDTDVMVIRRKGTIEADTARKQMQKKMKKAGSSVSESSSSKKKKKKKYKIFHKSSKKKGGSDSSKKGGTTSVDAYGETF